MKATKKPVTIEFFIYDGDLKNSDGKFYVPEWAQKAYEDGTIFFKDQGEMYIKTLEGDHHASVGDIIIRGVNGELYPCKPDIFEKTYDIVDSVSRVNEYKETKHDDELTRLKARIAELERMDTEHTLQIAKMNGYIHHLEEELEEERRWRKCSEELPEDGAEVLATDGDGIWLCYKTTMNDGSPWFQPDGLPHIEGVTHWKPLPSAPKEEK